VPWSSEKVQTYVEKLKAALVEPHLERFELQETYEQCKAAIPSYAEYWVVARGNGEYVEWFDPASGDFGLGLTQGDTGRLVSIGSRGDLVGVYCSM
jgi:hypothetical protein